MKPRIVILGLLCILLSSLSPMLAASRKDDAARFYEDALARFKRDDSAAAIVQLKNVLDLDPGMLAARVLLGKAYLRQADPASAEEALTKALNMGVDRSEVIIPFAQSLFDQAKYKDLLQKLPAEGLPRAQTVDLLVLRGQAFKATGDQKSAAAAFEQARRLDPDYVPVVLAHADLLLHQNDLPGATALVDRVLTTAPNNIAAWNFRAMIAQARGDIVAAIAAYSKVLSIEPRSLDGRIGRATLLIDLKRDQEAASDIEYFKREHPKDPRANYLRSVYLSRNGDESGALAALQNIKQMLDPVRKQRLAQIGPAFLFVGGLAHYGLGEPEQARDYFREYLKLDPNHPGARKLLGSILLAEGKSDEAINILEGAKLRTPSDPQLLALLAAAYTDRRRYRTATEYMERAVQVSGDDPEIQATLGVGFLGIGQRELALKHLQDALKGDPGQFRVGMVLAVLYLRQGLSKEAVQVAGAIVRANPRNVAALNLLGVANVAAGERKEGRTSYLKAIESDPNFFPPQINLAKLDAVEGNNSAARDRFLAILKIRPKDTQVMYELALLEQRAARTSVAIMWLEKAHNLNRRNTHVNSLLVQLYIAQNRNDAALNVAQATEAALPGDLSALASLGEVYVAMGNFDRARTIFDRMGVIAGFDVNKQYLIARHQVAANNLRGAENALGKALSVAPNFLPALVLLTEIEIQNGDLTKAEERARGVLNRSPKLAVGYRLIADIAMVKKDFASAIRDYKIALSREPNSDGAIRLYQAYVQAGMPDKGIDQLETWLKANPKDVQVIHVLAESHLRAGHFRTAQSWYEQLLALGVEGPAVFNNLANIFLRQGDSRAMSYAHKAHALAPHDPVVEDTLGWILVQQGQLEQGLRHLREARLRSPLNHEIRYHLAVALNRMGHAEDARSELEPAISSNAQFHGREEAQTLWGQLSTPQK